MKTVIVYDSNNLQSLMAAAAVASIRDVTPCDCRALLPLADLYVWLGVVPTIYYFENLDPSDYKHAKNVAIVNMATTKGLKNIQAKNVEYTYASSLEVVKAGGADIPVSNSYGSRGLLERALIYFKEDPNNFAHLSYMLKEFYSPKAPLELLQYTALNAKEAHHCLTTPGNLFILIPNSLEAMTPAEEAYLEYDAVAKVVLKDRWSTNWVKTAESPEPKTVMTFYESSLWWFVRRRIVRQDVILRNVSLSVTGTIVTSELPFVHGIRGSDPVFVY